MPATWHKYRRTRRRERHLCLLQMNLNRKERSHRRSRIMDTDVQPKPAGKLYTYLLGPLRLTPSSAILTCKTQAGEGHRRPTEARRQTFRNAPAAAALHARHIRQVPETQTKARHRPRTIPVRACPIWTYRRNCAWPQLRTHTCDPITISYCRNIPALGYEGCNGILPA